jgi:hypothetical protein
MKGEREMDQQACSDKITLSSLGLEHGEFIKLASTEHQLTPDMILSIFNLDGAAVSEIYQQAGIVPPYIDHRSMEGLYHVMMWMYLSGRATYGLDAHGKISYSEGLKDRDTIPTVNEDLMETRTVVDRIRSVLSIPYQYSWLVRFIAEALTNGTYSDRRAVLMAMYIGSKDTLVRPEYKMIEPYLDISAIRHQKKRICFSKMQMYCLMDRVRLDACHVYKGSRESYGNTLLGSITAKSKPLYNDHKVLLPNLDTSNKGIMSMLKCLKLTAQ